MQNQKSPDQIFQSKVSPRAPEMDTSGTILIPTEQEDELKEQPDESRLSFTSPQFIILNS